MALTAADKAAIVAEYQVQEGDTGSPEVQIALQTARIKDLSLGNSRSQEAPAIWRLEFLTRHLAKEMV